MKSVIPHEHIDARLLLRLGAFALIGLIMFGFVGYDVLLGELPLWMAVLGFILGLGVGYILGRILKVTWHETKQKAVMQMDIVGFIAIGVYVAFRFGENWVFGQFLSGVELSSLSLAVLSGLLFGRLFGLRISILKIVAENRPQQ
jgi:hypothetical protein